MSQLPVEEGIPRFKANEERVDQFVNADGYFDSNGIFVPSLITVINDLKAFNDRGAWVTATSYTVKDLVLQSGTWYVCVVAHTSGTFATDLSAQKWVVYQGVTSNQISAPGGAALVGFGSATAESHMQAYATDHEGTGSVSTAFGAVAVNKTRTTINRHAFEDWSTLNTTDTNLGYASFDAKPTMNNSLAQEHFNGYQARMVYNGSGGLTQHMEGFNATMEHTGTGTIVNTAAFNVHDVAGSGPIENNYGIFINNLVRGSLTNWAIYSAGGDSYFKDSLHVGSIVPSATNAQMTFAYNLDIASKSLYYGYSNVGTSQFGAHYFYDGKNNIALEILGTGLNARVGGTTHFAVSAGGTTTTGDAFATGKGYTNGAMRPGVFTNATLPTGVNGEVIYVSDGRKVGEGAGAGTGVMCYYSNGAWRTFSNDAVVTA